MARNKSFSPDDVLQKALHLFWDKGYHATSLSDLEREMGIGRKSLYNTFGSKRELFLVVLDEYFKARPPVEQPGAGWAAIQAWLNGGPSYNPGHRTCLMVKSTLEGAASDDPEIAARIARHNAQMLTGFGQALTQAIADGDLPEQDVEVSALFLCTTLQGLAVMSKGGTPFERLHQVAARAAGSPTCRGHRRLTELLPGASVQRASAQQRCERLLRMLCVVASRMSADTSSRSDQPGSSRSSSVASSAPPGVVPRGQVEKHVGHEVLFGWGSIKDGNSPLPPKPAAQPVHRAGSVAVRKTGRRGDKAGSRRESSRAKRGRPTNVPRLGPSLPASGMS